VNELLSPFTALNLFFALAGIVIWCLWARRYSDRWLYAVPPVSWLLHVAIFYLYVYGHLRGVLPQVNFAVWGSALTLHATFLIIGIGFITIFEKLLVSQHAK
jgi:hypothetical protein